MNELDRLMNKVLPEPNSGCWLWTGSLDGYGYGNFWFRGTWTKSHRASYILHKGPISSDREIDHLCRVPACINPDHLEAVTHSTNMLRGPNHHRDKTHCINGHLLDETNTWIRPKTGQRCCRECARLRDQKYRQQAEAKALALLRSQRHRQRLKAAALALLLLTLSPLSVRAATDVWLFWGWGPNGWSSGIDQIARRVRALRGVNAVHVYDYRETQRAYNEAVATPREHSLAFVGYSCGGNATLSVCSALNSNNRICHAIALQPSQWCGRFQTTPNMVLQDTWSAGTFGLGSYQPEGPPAQYTTFVERPNPHGAADTDQLYQRDAVFAVGAVADPSRRYVLERHLQRTAPHVDRQDAQVIWRRE